MLCAQSREALGVPYFLSEMNDAVKDEQRSAMSVDIDRKVGPGDKEEEDYLASDRVEPAAALDEQEEEVLTERRKVPGIQWLWRKEFLALARKWMEAEKNAVAIQNIEGGHACVIQWRAAV
uniref:Uncharacterized protein n=1 Tax=Parascaris equorum TaxID=6256 RepID=A0A914RQV5_PAREQ